MWLTILILAGLVVGGIVGQVLYWSYGGDVPGGWMEGFDFVGGTVFMGLLKMVLVPLVVSSVVVGVASLRGAGELGKIGGLTVLYYFGTMLAAVILGVVLVSVVKPGDPNGDGSGIGAGVIEKGTIVYAQQEAGKRVAIEQKGEAGKHGVKGALWVSVRNIVEQMIPESPVAAAAEGRFLGLIAFSLILGAGMTVVGEKARAMKTFFESLFAVILKLVDWILWLAPLGVMCLVAKTVAQLGAAELVKPLGLYMAVVVGGLGIHGLVVLPLVLWILGRVNPYRFMHQMRAALMTAFGTDSSTATLPVTMESAVEEGGCSRKSAGFVLPLGAQVNMDGTALYEAVAVVFLFQCYGIGLHGTELGIIVITATLAAVGAAGIPSAGLVTMVIVVEAVNQSLGGDKLLPLSAVGIILGVDRILDMCRTTVNVWGDAVGAKIMSRVAVDDAMVVTEDREVAARG